MADGTIWCCPSVRDSAPAAHSGARGKPPCRQTSLADLGWPACLVTDAVRRAGSPWAHSRACSIAGGGTVPGRHSFRLDCGQASEQRPGRARLSPAVTRASCHRRPEDRCQSRLFPPPADSSPAERVLLRLQGGASSFVSLRSPHPK